VAELTFKNRRQKYRQTSGVRKAVHFRAKLSIQALVEAVSMAWPFSER
jgi:hypothetical protein